MADFYQNGIITTLHNLQNRPTSQLEEELTNFAIHRPMGLILPSLYSELQGPALSNIVNELSAVPYLDQIVIGLDRATEKDYRHALNFFSRMPQEHKVLWNDGPRLKAIDDSLRDLDLAPKELGKGRNVWYCMGYILASGRTESIALHDCDIKTYDRSLLARLIYPVAHPSFSYEFCKGYYARTANGKMHGRACRLLVTPLLGALKKILGQMDYLDYMTSFRYALAGEFSFRRDVLRDIRIPSDWGLEIGVLSEMYRNYAKSRVCQVDIANSYDHKHQPLSPEDAKNGLSKMSIDIAKAIFRKLATQGVVFERGTFRSIKATYYRIALDAVENSNNDAIMNGLTLDVHSEEKAVELFSKNIMKAGEVFLERPSDRPFIASWNRVISAVPDIFEQLLSAVEADNKEYMEHVK
ncbi:MAG: glycosyl transferase [Cellvibrionales bacterium TMED49]|nr:glycosyl transferase [Porticoccaceae bacterium]OUU40050.1 MAG: glycosyl transferase [Cellvibrionales bacterium TMED49]